MRRLILTSLFLLPVSQSIAHEALPGCMPPVQGPSEACSDYVPRHNAWCSSGGGVPHCTCVGFMCGQSRICGLDSTGTFRKIVIDGSGAIERWTGHKFHGWFKAADDAPACGG